MDFELHPIRQAGGDGEARQADGFLGVHRAAGVGQRQIFLRVNGLQDVRERVLLPAQIGAAEGDGDQFRAAGGERVAHGFRRREFARAKNQARPEGSAPR